MFVYLIRDGETSLYKIGITHNLENRLKQLNGNQSPNEKHIVFSIEVINAKPTEEILHNKYKKYNHRYEWFCLNDKQVESVIEDMNFLKNNEQILYSGDYEEENNDDEMRDRMKQVLLLAERLEPYEIAMLVSKIMNSVAEKLATQEEFSDGDDDDDDFKPPTDDNDDFVAPSDSDDDDDFVVADDDDDDDFKSADDFFAH